MAGCGKRFENDLGNPRLCTTNCQCPECLSATRFGAALDQLRETNPGATVQDVLVAKQGELERKRAEAHAPFVPGEHFKPMYYQPVKDNPRIDNAADVEDVVHAWGLGPQRAEALRHLIRAGRKPGESTAKDLTKVLEWVQREISFMAMEDDGQ